MGYMLFLDLDDCLIESSKFIQAAVDKNTNFKNKKLEYLEQTVAQSQFLRDCNAKEIARAFEKCERPLLIGMAKIGSNDIDKTSLDSENISEDERKKRIYERWYKKPLDLVNEILSVAKWEKEMFLEERDNFLENDNTLPKSEAAIDYDFIYQKGHLINGVMDLVKTVSEHNIYENIYVLSHHNGGREEKAKERLVSECFEDTTFLGLRFHLDKYQKDVRRPRSSKAKYAMEKLGLSSLENCILVDDSQANLDDWIKHGGIAILYRPKSEDELIQGYQDSHGTKYPRITKMNEDEIRFAIMETTGKSLRKSYM